MIFLSPSMVLSFLIAPHMMKNVNSAKPKGAIIWKFAQPSIATGLQHWVVFQCIALAFANSIFFWLLSTNGEGYLLEDQRQQ
jgi:hypothetical protein